MGLMLCIYICKHIILTKYMLKKSKQQEQQQATVSLTLSYNYQLFILKEKKR